MTIKKAKKTAIKKAPEKKKPEPIKKHKVEMKRIINENQEELFKNIREGKLTVTVGGNTVGKLKE